MYSSPGSRLQIRITLEYSKKYEIVFVSLSLDQKKLFNVKTEDKKSQDTLPLTVSLFHISTEMMSAALLNSWKLFRSSHHHEDPVKLPEITFPGLVTFARRSFQRQVGSHIHIVRPVQLFLPHKYLFFVSGPALKGASHQK